MKRNEGFYCVIINDGNQRGWEIAEQVDGFWMVLGISKNFTDKNMTQIDEKQIKK